MIADLKPYPVMKESGVGSLGLIPEHWEVRRNGTLFAQRNETGFAELPILEVSLRTGVRVRDLENTDRKQVMSDRSKYKRAVSGDIAYNMMRMWQGAVGVAPTDGLISPAYVVARPLAGTVPRYFEKLFRTDAYKREVDGYSSGIVKDRNRLYWQDFKAMPSCRPPTEEQASIVRYLDRVDHRIRRLVRAKRKFIKLLEEQKQAIIHRAVTRGLDPEVPLKDSGVEWLGEVPKHWDVTALRLMYHQCLGKMLDSKRVTGVAPLPYLRNTDVQWDRINVVDLPVMDIPTSEYSRYTVRPGDLLVCEGGEIGRTAVWSGELEVCGFQKALHRLRPRDITRQQPRFLYFSLRAACHRSAFSDGHVSTIPHLTGEKLRAHRFAFPPVGEQEAIVDYLDRRSSETDATIARARQEIALLHEYRTRLIADVVTGKLDVRHAAAAIPDGSDVDTVGDAVSAFAETVP